MVIEHYPLHDDRRSQILESWNMHKYGLFKGFLTGYFEKGSLQPLHLIANYYGEKMAFFYAYLVFYTAWLMIPAVPGLGLFIY